MKIKAGQGTIVDVRTREEFNIENVNGSVNIPLQELSQRVEELKKMQQPLILCCASGGRSSKAHGYLQQQGINCINAGSFLNVKNTQH